jgi:Leucine-rich repeat (LRR) protein
LKYLDLSKNNLRKIESTTFHSLSKLRILDLSVNAIEQFDSILILGLNNLEKIYLDKNQFMINLASIQNFKKIEFIFGKLFFQKMAILKFK